MREQEYSSPGREYSQPGTEFAPAGQAFQRGEGEYFPQVPELANAQEATDVSGQLGRPRRKKRAGRGGGIIRQAAAAVAIGAVTVTTVVAAGGDLPGFNWDRYDRDTQYIYTEFTDEQRDYLDRALELMEDGDDLAVETLLGDEGETFDEIYRGIVLPLGQDLADRNGFNGPGSAYVGYDGRGFFYVWGDDLPNSAFITLSGDIGSDKFFARHLYFDGNDTLINAVYDNGSNFDISFSWELDSFKDPSGSGSELVRRIYRNATFYEARLTGTFADLYSVDGKYFIRTLSDGTAQYRAGMSLDDSTVGTATVEDFVTVSHENMEFSSEEQDGSLYVNVVIQGDGRISHTYIVSDLIAPQKPTDYAKFMIDAGTPAYQFGEMYELGNSPDELDGGPVGGPDDGQDDEPADEVIVETGTGGDGITWTLSESGVLTFSGSGPMWDFPENEPDRPWSYAHTGIRITDIIIGQNITSVGSYLFHDVDVHIGLGRDLVTLGEGSFYETRHSYVDLTKQEAIKYLGKMCFKSSTLSKLDLPPELAEIGDEAFADCKNLTSVTVPETVTHIGQNAFAGDTKLATVTFKGGVTEILDGAFSGCTKLGSVALPEGASTLGAGVFSGCTKLTRADLPESLTSAGSDIFDGCTALRDVYFGGSKSQWNKLGIAVADTVTVHFQKEDEIVGSGQAGDDITWTLTESGDLTFTGTGEMYDYTETAPWISQTGFVHATTVVFDDRITHIGDFALRAGHYVTSVHIPEGLVSIGNSAFSECYEVESFDLPDTLRSIGEYAFGDCRGMQAMELPEGLETIGVGAFDGVFSLKTVNIPGSVKSIPEQVFSCPELEDITISEGVESIGPFNFEFCKFEALILPESIRTLDNLAIYSCDGLKYAYVPAGVAVGGENVFFACNNLTDIYFGGTEDEWNGLGQRFNHSVTIHFNAQPSDVPSSGDTFSGQAGDNITWTLTEDGTLTLTGTGDMYDFFDISDIPWSENKTNIYITRAVVGEGITRIGSYALYGAERLTSVQFPSTLTAIGSRAFMGCNDLEAVDFPEGLESIGSYAFNGCNALESVVLPDSLTTLDTYAFYNCLGLKSVVIPGSVGTINRGAFSGCESLSSLTMGEGISVIGGEAFSSCTALTDVVVPEGVTSVEYWAFNHTGLTNLTLPPSVTSFVAVGEGDIPNFSDLYYTGTVEQFTAFWGDPADGFLGATVHIGQSGPAPSAGGSFSGQAGDSITWELTGGGALTFTGTGDMYDFTASDGAPWCYETTGVRLRTVIFNGNFGRIGNYALAAQSMNQVAFTGSVREIGEHAFDSCEQLRQISLPDGLGTIGEYAFTASAVERVTLPETVYFISKNAFLDCTALDQIELPGSVRSIGAAAFRSCTALTSVVFRTGDARVDIGSEAFEGCSSLTDLYLPDVVGSVYENAFQNCIALPLIYIPGDITLFSPSAIDGCASLSDIYFGGTEDEWFTVTQQRPPTAFVVHYDVRRTDDGTLTR